jgi:hypothetical protein
VGLRLFLLGAGLASLAATADAAPRARTRFDGIRDCERLASVQFRRHNPAFRRFTIDRARVTVDRYADRVGNNFVTAVYHGGATYDAGKGPESTRFICLQGGTDALFVYTLPD